jgi:hypothetical protein
MGKNGKKRKKMELEKLQTIYTSVAHPGKPGFSYEILPVIGFWQNKTGFIPITGPNNGFLNINFILFFIIF